VSELRAAADRLGAPREPAHSWAATGTALLTIVALSILDASWNEIIAATVVIAPFIAAVFASPRQTAGVAVVAALSALLSGIWNDNLADAGYFVRLAIVVIGGAFAVVAARTRLEASRA
jgi:hypothetical protein